MRKQWLLEDKGLLMRRGSGSWMIGGAALNVERGVLLMMRGMDFMVYPA